MKSFRKFSHISNNFSQQKHLDSPVFSNVSRLKHSSRMNSTLQTEIEHFLHNLLQVHKQNDTTLLLDQSFSSK